MPMDLILPCDGTGELPVHAATAMPPADAASAPATRFLTIGGARFAPDRKMPPALAARGNVYDCGNPGQPVHPPVDLPLSPIGGWDDVGAGKGVSVPVRSGWGPSHKKK